MNNIFEANQALLQLIKDLIAKLKVLKNENTNLKNQIATNNSQLLLTEEQKTEIEQLLAVAKSLTEEA